MEKTSEILNELQAISPFLANIDKINVFEVPEDYFQLLDKRIITTVLLTANGKNEVQTVPEGYFEALSNKILSAIKNTENVDGRTDDAKEEIKNISPVLFSLKDKYTFSVPEHYFENFSDTIFAKLKPKKAKVISINRSTRWWKYVAAAVIACVIMIGALQLFNEKSSGDKFSLASANVPDYIKLSFQYKTPEQLYNGIASLSDADIVNYLQQHGNVLDDDLISNNIDTTELPDAADYLINDNTLNNFLKMDNANAQGQ